MTISVILAKMFAVYFLLIGISLLTNASYYKSLIQELVEKKALRLVIGLIRLVLGMLLITFHNLWVMDWRILITVLAWTIFIAGSMNLLCPKYLPRKLLSSYNDVGVRISGYCTLAFGIYFLYFGFIVFYLQ